MSTPGSRSRAFRKKRYSQRGKESTIRALIILFSTRVDSILWLFSGKLSPSTSCTETFSSYFPSFGGIHEMLPAVSSEAGISKGF